jgi:hypothetical protein
MQITHPQEPDMPNTDLDLMPDDEYHKYRTDAEMENIFYDVRKAGEMYRQKYPPIINYDDCYTPVWFGELSEHAIGTFESLGIQ